MTRLSVSLLLCCELSLAVIPAAAATDPPGRPPWIDRNDLVPSVPPIQPQAPASIPDDWSPAPARQSPWMETARERFVAQAPQAEPTSIDYAMQVFISEGIPEGALRLLFRQALDERPGQVRFVLRGFEPQRLGPLIGRLRQLFPDPHGDDILIEIDPEAFRAYQVETVPVFLVKDGSDWFEVQGMTSLEGARDNVRRRGPLEVGERYAIQEPDILAVIEARTRDYDWTAALERARGRLAANLSPQFDLPTVTQNAEARFSPIFIVPTDIVIPEYNNQPEVVLARAGARYNLLDHTRLQVPIIVFDAGDARQLRMVEQWIGGGGAYAQADLFAVGASAEPERPGTVVLAERLHRPVFPWFGRMSERFGVQAVPAIVDQVDRELRIRYVAPSVE